MSDYVIKKGQRYIYKRRVPAEYSSLDSRKFVEKGLRTRDLVTALNRAKVVNDAVEQYWENLSRYNSDDAMSKYEAAIRTARHAGFEYKTVSELNDGSLRDLLDRLKLTEGKEDAASDKLYVDSLIGGVDRPNIMLSDLPDLFFERIAVEIKGKSEKQLKKYKQPRERAVNNFIASLKGDKALKDIMPEDGQVFRAWWDERVLKAGLKPQSANKDFSYLKRMVREVCQAKGLPYTDPFQSTRIKVKGNPDTYPFSDNWIRGVILAPRALAGLNDEARDIVLMAINTAMSASEIVGLMSDDIVLDCDIPHVIIRPNENRGELKSAYRRRKTPLVGVSLAAAKRRKVKGFPRYLGNTDTYSATVNKYFRENGLMESENHSVYSFRHTFQDHLTRLEVPPRVDHDLMGHSLDREKYGEGASLEQKQKWIKKFAY
ncbi:DUF6538 domain-containing protein [Terasakiella sp.]|uniref:DUF6538 domain-containing protein n=1 Tax=Terasakiella sp. TaxID=2034861 RepID=UPI003AA88093